MRPGGTRWRIHRHPHPPAVHARITIGETKQRTGVPGLEIQHIAAAGRLAAKIAGKLGIAAELGIHAEAADLAGTAREFELEVAQRFSVETDHGAEPQIEIEIDRRLIFGVGPRAGNRSI